jgi:hypothetical protein
MVFHVLNRGVARMELLGNPAHYQALEQVLGEKLGEYPMQICTYTVMPNSRSEETEGFEALRRSVHCGRPLGRLEWQGKTQGVRVSDPRVARRASHGKRAGAELPCQRRGGPGDRQRSD